MYNRVKRYKMQSPSWYWFFVCTMIFSCGDSQKKNNEQVKSQTINFVKDIAPIIHQKCMPCHRPGSAGPFSLITYHDVRKRAKMIKMVTATRYMPPWPADPTYSNFTDERYLSETEISTITKWVNSGAALGDTTKMKPLPIYPNHSLLGKPDLTLSFPDSFYIKGNNTDQFYVMKMPYELKKDTFLQAIEFVPKNKKLLHHADIHLVQYLDTMQKKDYTSGEWFANMEEAYDYNEIFSRLNILNDNGTYPLLTPSVSHYLPGAINTKYSNNIGGFKMHKRGVILLNSIHYGPTPIPSSDYSKINIFFRKTPPSRPTFDLVMGNGGSTTIRPTMKIPADTIMTFNTQVTVNKDLTLLTVNPHMHLLGQSFLAYAITPKNDTLKIIRIKKWDFRWQYFYTFKQPLKIPAGSTIYAFGTYNNTSRNKNNPFSPPRLIDGTKSRMKSTEEMFQMTLTYLPYKIGDENLKMD